MPAADPPPVHRRKGPRHNRQRGRRQGQPQNQRPVSGQNWGQSAGHGQREGFAYGAVPRAKVPAPYRPGAEGDRLYGLNPVERALAAGRRRLWRLHVRPGRLSERVEQVRQQAALRGVPVQETPPEELEALCGTATHQGVVLECGALPLLDETLALPPLAVASEPGAAPAPTTGGAALEGAPAPAAPPLVVALDQVEDPQNFGAIVRSCALFGVTGVVVPRHHAAPLSPAASKASAGELETFPVAEVANLAHFLEQSKAAGWWVAAAVPEGGTALPAYRREVPLILVVGNEGRGLRPLVERQCDLRLTIPLRTSGNLNVSAAVAVLLYQLLCQPNLPSR
jgi:23S rRNA (guanosine2251-2'-O)-methyltransferase